MVNINPISIKTRLAQRTRPSITSKGFPRANPRVVCNQDRFLRPLYLCSLFYAVERLRLVMVVRLLCAYAPQMPWGTFSGFQAGQVRGCNQHPLQAGSVTTMIRENSFKVINFTLLQRARQTG